ncbi:alanine--tRNA ligase [Fontivita pretiosa]|uniref:alanine--tRNA ligase n=1 Tax=Fontivita pretiosa TaxID=2989684 RepID=UPI003D16F914
MTSNEIRRQFIDFFVTRHGHTFVPSSPVVPHDDPTLLFTNAGMNQFKPIFLGIEKRDYVRAVNSQKCIRAGGKHNDLDDVGRSRRHHTFFEMLGNWSFGDYFKAEAIEWAWELLTKVWKLDPTRLHVTCFEGDEANGVPRDVEAARLWKQIAGLPDDHIHFFGKDNFWEMGETGPCGPCSEIHIDRTPDKSGGQRINGDDPRVMEIWNLVFIQYNRNPDRSLTPLPAKHVDTGMGFERICHVLQGKQDNYAIDLFDPFWDALTAMTGIKYTGQFPPTNAPNPELEAANEQLRHDIAFRVIADHARCLTFALTDGAVPGNEGRGYVLRRILRRAVRFGRQQLGLRDPFLHRMVDVVVQAMGEAFPELKRDPARVAQIIRDEEISFGRTLDRGLALFEEAARAAAARGTSQISAADAFKLHDTYGFPIDLTEIMAAERGMTVDKAGYEKLMEEARNRARAAGQEGQTGIYELTPAALAELAREGIAPTDDSAKYQTDPIRARVVAIWNGSNLDPSADPSADQEVAVILDRTNFYAEMGGQVGDSGVLASAGACFDVETTRMVGGYVLHVGRVRSGCIRVGDEVTATVSPARFPTMQNHTGTHLANWALREVLGDGVEQKGSLVDPLKLRFDFSYGKSLDDEQVAQVEALVNQCIARKMPVYAQVVPQEQALKINGLRAVFGEKYPPMVRVVSIGVTVEELLKDPLNPRWRQYSIEFCGGTHLRNTAEVEEFVITAEESVSKGVRRIVALTGAAARAAAQRRQELEAAIANARSLPESQLARELQALQKQLGADDVPLLARRRGQAAIAELQARYRAWEKAQQKAAASIDIGATAAELVAAGPIMVAAIEGASDEQLRGVIDSIRKRTASFAALLASSDGQRVSFVAAVSDDLIAKGLKAGDWVREAAKVAGGGGGGRPQMAQAGGKDPSRLPESLQAAREFARRILG